MTGFSEETLNKLWPNGDKKIAGLRHGLAVSQQRVYEKYAIHNNTVVAQMMAQFSHECGAGLEMVESTAYSAERAAEVWPITGKNDYRHFANASDCYAKCKSWPGDPDFQRKLFNLVYGDRMGNRPGTNDGYDLRGRGLSQLTGRENYTKCGEKVGLDLVGNPALTCDPSKALEVAVADFILCGCLPYAEVGDTLNVTKRLNGGTIGLAEREQWLSRWKAALATPQTPPTPVEPPVAVPAPTKKPAIPATAKKVGGAVVAGTAGAAAAHAAGVDGGIIASVLLGAAGIAGIIYLIRRKSS